MKARGRRPSAFIQRSGRIRNWTIQYTMWKCLPACLLFYFPSLPESQNVPCQNRRILGNYNPFQNRRTFVNNKKRQVSSGFQSNLSFCVDNGEIKLGVTWSYHCGKRQRCMTSALSLCSFLLIVHLII